MSYASSDLNQEIQARLSKLTESGTAILKADAIAFSILSEHHHIAGDDVEFYEYVAVEYVKNQVRTSLNRYKLRPEVEPDPQLLLPGFGRVQRYYAVDCKGEQQFIHVDWLTQSEKSAKVAELRAMAQGCHRHADELERYRPPMAA